MSKISLTALTWAPPMVQGLVRDLRVAWALEEAGLAYERELLALDQLASPGNTARQPFSQVPVYREDDLVIFESGAIVLHIAQRSAALLPQDTAARTRAISWMFAALTSVEPFILGLFEVDVVAAGAEWARLRRPDALHIVHRRLGELTTYLGDRDWLEGEFTAGDLLMIAVLRILRDCQVMQDFPRLQAYVQRGEARPAFQRALAAQLAPFAQNAPA